MMQVCSVRVALCFMLVACAGTIEDPSGATDPGGSTAGGGSGSGGGRQDPPLPPHDSIASSRSGVRRLSKEEIRQTVKDLLRIDPGDFLYGWPNDHGAFDTNYADASPSDTLLDAIKAMADGVADKVIHN